MAPPRLSRYAWWPLRVVDGVTVALTAPLTHSLSLAASCYTLTTHDNVSTVMMFVRFAVVGPLLFIVSMLALLPGVIGWLLWVVLNTYAADLIQPFYYHAPTHPNSHPGSHGISHLSSHPKSIPVVCKDDQPLTSHPESQQNSHPVSHPYSHPESQPNSHPGSEPDSHPVNQTNKNPAGQSQSHPASRGARSHPFRVTVSSANVLLCPEVVSRFNNCPKTSWRLKEISRRLLRQDRELNLHPNLRPPVQREQVVVSQFPEVDIFLLQEVLERWVGGGMVAALQDAYPYCVYDVGTHSRHTNLFMCGSGLFLASKFPVLDCAFHPFSHYSHYGCVVGLGVLLAKLDLGVVVRAGKEVRAVGYIANTHTQAYQGDKNIVSLQLTEADAVYARYIRNTHDAHTETLMFAVLGGDFNSDNMSEGDHRTQNLPLWDYYIDPCRAGAGRDQAWAVGTEHRQKQLSHPALTHPSTFRDMLLDDALRRHFILDADVKVHTLELIRVQPRPDSDGQVRATPEGGRRRIDYLLLRKGGHVQPSSYWFTSAIAGLTDHLPVVMMLEEKEEEEEGVKVVGEEEEKEEESVVGEEEKEEEMRKEEKQEMAGENKKDAYKRVEGGGDKENGEEEMRKEDKKEEEKVEESKKDV